LLSHPRVLQLAATVGMPVTRHPPCSPGRAVFPHPVPRLHSLPRRPCPFPGTPCLLWPAGREAHAAPVRHVRDACPVRAAGFRRDLPRVVGFPHLRVLGSRRLPRRLRRACSVTVRLRLPVTWGVAARRFQPGSVSGFPLPCLRSCRPYAVAPPCRSCGGLPSSATSLFLPAAACGLRRTGLSLPKRRGLGGLRERSNPRRPLLAFSKLYQHCRVRGHPDGLQDALSTLRPSCSSCVRPRLRHGRKTRYGWVASPDPAGTCTRPETPSFSWRENAGPEPLPEAGAQRTLEAVSCRPMLDLVWGDASDPPDSPPWDYRRALDLW
jgi:hypothetical protein